MNIAQLTFKFQQTSNMLCERESIIKESETSFLIY